MRAIKEIDGVLAELSAKENRELADWFASKDFVTLTSSSDLISFTTELRAVLGLPLPFQDLH